jgi:hypothetical protein
MNFRMPKFIAICSIALLVLTTACSKSRLEEKGFPVSSSYGTDAEEPESGLKRDSLVFQTRPSNVLLTGVPPVRLTPIYKVNLNKRNKNTFIGSNSFYSTWEDPEVHDDNNWNGNLMPGFAAMSGYNLVNVSHFDAIENKQRNLFEKPVLINTLYFPSFTKDTLNGQPVSRNFIMVSAYDEDTNKDGLINRKDLRRFYLFNIAGERQKALVPEDHAVFKSEYDSGNDYMFVFAQHDTNKNGMRDESEPTHIFWIDLKDPSKTGQMY